MISRDRETESAGDTETGCRSEGDKARDQEIKRERHQESDQERSRETQSLDATKQKMRSPAMTLGYRDGAQRRTAQQKEKKKKKTRHREKKKRCHRKGKRRRTNDPRMMASDRVETSSASVSHCRKSAASKCAMGFERDKPALPPP